MLCVLSQQKQQHAGGMQNGERYDNGRAAAVLSMGTHCQHFQQRWISGGDTLPALPTLHTRWDGCVSCVSVALCACVHPSAYCFIPFAAQAARADALARQLKRVEGVRSSSLGSLSRLKRENEALKGLLLELAADRQAAQTRLAELQDKMAEMALTTLSSMGDVSSKERAEQLLVV